MSAIRQKIDFLIIGQGLAGSLLAWQLLQRGHSVRVIAGNQPGGSSQVAGGLVNPLAGLRFGLPDRIEDWLNAAHAIYAELEQALATRLWHPLPMWRLFRSEKQVRFWRRRLDDPKSRANLGRALSAEELAPAIHAPWGGFEQRRTGFLELPALLRGMADLLAGKGLLEDAVFDPTELEIQPGSVRWHGLEADCCVFCEGFRALDNPWFGHLPVRPVRGEILTIALREPVINTILNGEVWLIPLGDGRYRLGATHGYDHSDTEPSVSGAQELIAKLADLLPGSPEAQIIDHAVGIRPATHDKKPLLGRHPEHQQLAICNGFGARGVLIGPWHVERLVDHLLNRAPLPDDADITRFAP